MSRTVEKLRDAFTGESKANRRYLAYALRAEEEGLNQVSRLFRAVAEAETIHAMNHLRMAGDIGETQKNLEEAISGETFEYTEMYPDYLEVARDEGNKQAEWSFDVANQVEELHAGLFKDALVSLKGGEDMEEKLYYVCGVCGNTVESSPPEECPICQAPEDKFKKIE